MAQNSVGDTASVLAAAQKRSQADATAEIQRLIVHGHATDALDRLDRMATLAPVPAGVQRLRGMALYSEDKLLLASEAFTKALTQDPSDALATQMNGIALYRLGRPAEAIPFLESAARMGSAEKVNAPGQPGGGPVDPQYVLGLCYLDTRRYDDSRRAFAAQYGFDGDSAPAYLLASRMMLRREFIPVAQEFARKALELSPGLPLAHRLLGETELAGNHLDEAIAQFEQERKLNPLDPPTYSRLGDAYVRKGDYDDARRSLQEAVLLDPNATGPFILLGKVLLKQEDAAGASTYLEHARDMDPQNFMTHSLLGQAYRQMGRQEDARVEIDLSQRLQAAAAPKIGDVQ